MITRVKRGERAKRRGQGRRKTELTGVSFCGEFLGDVRHTQQYTFAKLVFRIMYVPSRHVTHVPRHATSRYVAQPRVIALRRKTQRTPKHRRRSPFIKSLPPTRLPGFTVSSVSRLARSRDVQPRAVHSAAPLYLLAVDRFFFLRHGGTNRLIAAIANRDLPNWE